MKKYSRFPIVPAMRFFKNVERVNSLRMELETMSCKVFLNNMLVYDKAMGNQITSCSPIASYGFYKIYAIKVFDFVLENPDLSTSLTQSEIGCLYSVLLQQLT